jgi:polyphosphate kinase 2 (PPK2 family)
VLDALQKARRQRPPAAGKPQVRPRRISRSPSALATLDMSRAVDRSSYEPALAKAQMRLFELTHSRDFDGRALICAFEGNDAAGKGGAIRRLTGALDARHYQVVQVGAPTEEERAQPYLWRFWRQLPRRARVTIFDRSWYGRVLVERVEGFCSEADWLRAYAEINDFEDQLVAAGTVVVKFWLSISKDEQLVRFQAREAEPHKRFKITADDWRNRERWDDYERAVCDMVDRSSTEIAPWTLVEANNKLFARIKVLTTLADRLEAALEQA